MSHHCDPLPNRRPVTLTTAQHEVALAERARLRQLGPVRDPKLSGCMLAFIGMIVLTLTPAVGGWLDIPPGLALGILAGAVLLLGGGAAMGLVGGSRQETEAARAREESLEMLARWTEGGASEDEAIRASVRFLHAGGGLIIDGAAGVSPEARALIGRVARARLED